MTAAHWHVYILECADGTLYTGIARDITSRITAHNNGTGAKYTRGRQPVRLLYQETAANRGIALRREASLKKLSRADKLELIGQSLNSLAAATTG